jgi:hypothetical protein
VTPHATADFGRELIVTEAMLASVFHNGAAQARAAGDQDTTYCAFYILDNKNNFAYNNGDDFSIYTVAQ